MGNKNLIESDKQELYDLKTKPMSNFKYVVYFIIACIMLCIFSKRLNFIITLLAPLFMMYFINDIQINFLGLIALIVSHYIGYNFVLLRKLNSSDYIYVKLYSKETLKTLIERNKR